MHESFAQRVAANARAEMARRGRTQTAVARHLGVSQQSLSRRLSGHIAFSTVEIDELAKCLGVPVSVLTASDDHIPAATA